MRNRKCKTDRQYNGQKLTITISNKSICINKLILTARISYSR